MDTNGSPGLPVESEQGVGGGLFLPGTTSGTEDAAAQWHTAMMMQQVQVQYMMQQQVQACQASPTAASPNPNYCHPLTPPANTAGLDAPATDAGAAATGCRSASGSSDDTTAAWTCPTLTAGDPGADDAGTDALCTTRGDCTGRYAPCCTPRSSDSPGRHVRWGCRAAGSGATPAARAAVPMPTQCGNSTEGLRFE